MQLPCLTGRLRRAAWNLAYQRRSKGSIKSTSLAGKPVEVPFWIRNRTWTWAVSKRNESQDRVVWKIAHCQTESRRGELDARRVCPSTAWRRHEGERNFNVIEGVDRNEIKRVCERGWKFEARSIGEDGAHRSGPVESGTNETRQTEVWGRDTQV